MKMKMELFGLGFLLSGVLMASVASADPVIPPDVVVGLPIRVGAVTSNGSGCRQGSVGVSLSDDRQTMSVLFSESGAEVGRRNRRRFNEKDCTLRIPIEIPSGVRFSVVGYDFRGYVNAPRGGSARMHTEHRLRAANDRAWIRPLRQLASWAGGSNTDFFLSERVDIPGPYYRVICGQNMQVDLRMTWEVQSNPQLVDGLISMDSVDKGVTYNLRWHRCS
jgi:hypothetical protein